MAKTVLVTGSSGYIGRHVVAALLEQGCTVLAVHRGERGPDPRAISINADFSAFNPRWFDDTGVADVCIHLAWTDGFNHNAPSHIEMLPKHAQFAADVMAAGVKQFVGMGSIHEVGYWEGQVDEETPNQPRSKYGIAKNALRELVRLEAKSADVVFQWLRAFYIFGDDRNNHSLFTKILEMDASGMSSFPFNSGVNKYDFISVQQLATHIAAVAGQTEVTGVIDCCTGNPVALRDKVEEFIAGHALKIRPEYGVYPRREYDSPAIWGSTTKIDRILKAMDAEPCLSQPRQLHASIE